MARDYGRSSNAMLRNISNQRPQHQLLGSQNSLLDVINKKHIAYKDSLNQVPYGTPWGMRPGMIETPESYLDYPQDLNTLHPMWNMLGEGGAGGPGMFMNPDSLYNNNNRGQGPVAPLDSWLNKLLYEESMRNTYE